MVDTIIDTRMQSGRLQPLGARARVASWARHPGFHYLTIAVGTLFVCIVAMVFDRSAERGTSWKTFALIIAGVTVVLWIVELVRRTFLDIREIETNDLLKFAQRLQQSSGKEHAASAGVDELAETDAAGRLAFIITETMDGLVSVASKIVGANVAVSIKLFKLPSSASGREPVLFTFARDTRSTLERPDLRGEFLCHDDTAFDTLVRENRSKARFECSDLPALARHSQFKSSNRAWRRFYTSKVVVPICDTQEPTLDSLLGFLCIDSFAGDVSDPRLRPVITQIAKELYRMLSAMPVTMLEDNHA